MESSFGKWEGLTDHEVAELSDSWKARTADRWNTRPPSGESYADVNSRVGEWYQRGGIITYNNCGLPWADFTRFTWDLFRPFTSGNF